MVVARQSSNNKSNPGVFTKKLLLHKRESNRDKLGCSSLHFSGFYYENITTPLESSEWGSKVTPQLGASLMFVTHALRVANYIPRGHL